MKIKKTVSIITGTVLIILMTACSNNNVQTGQPITSSVSVNDVLQQGMDANVTQLPTVTVTPSPAKTELTVEEKTAVENSPTIAELNKIPEIVECHYTTGPYTMLVKLYARDNEQLMDLLNRKIQGITGVDSTETLISLDQSIKKEVPICVTDKPEEKVQKGGKAKIILDDDE